MGRLLKNVKDIDNFMDAVKGCESDVIIYNRERNETFNLKSTLSLYIALGELAKDRGDEWEVFTSNRSDEARLLNFFHELNS